VASRQELWFNRPLEILSPGGGEATPSNGACVFRESFEAAIGGDFVVLTVGNDLRGDDGVGPYVARVLADRFPDRIFDGGQAPENFLGPLRRSKAGMIVIVDAADFGGTTGDIRVMAGDEVDGAGISTHAAPLGMLMRAFAEELNARVLLIAVQAGQTRLGAAMSDEVRHASERVAEELARALGAPSDRKTRETES